MGGNADNPLNRPFWGASDRWQINFLGFSGNQVDLRALNWARVRSIELDAVVLAYTSDNLARARIFSMKVLKLLDLRW